MTRTHLQGLSSGGKTVTNFFFNEPRGVTPAVENVIFLPTLAELAFECIT